MAILRIALITSDQQRHRWIASQLAMVGDLVAVVSERKPVNSQARSDHSNLEISEYFREREMREAFWFSDTPRELEAMTPALLRCPWGQGNDPATFKLLVEHRPDLIFLFGSSIIRDPILAYFKKRVINMHLGLSPYYRGSSTNFWPLVDGLPECVGVTVHYATLKVDGGNILLQARPNVALGDSSHDLGCKSIIAGAALLQEVVKSSNSLTGGRVQTGAGKLCRRDDFNLEALRCLKRNFDEGIISSYIKDKAQRDARYPILDNLFPSEGLHS